MDKIKECYYDVCVGYDIFECVAHRVCCSAFSTIKTGLCQGKISSPVRADSAISIKWRESTVLSLFLHVHFT